VWSLVPAQWRPLVLAGVSILCHGCVRLLCCLSEHAPEQEEEEEEEEDPGAGGGSGPGSATAAGTFSTSESSSDAGDASGQSSGPTPKLSRLWRPAERERVPYIWGWVMGRAKKHCT
jgi:hypothetical protein